MTKRLPQVSYPTYDLVLPSNGKKLKFRPFLVKEEKLLLLASQEQDVKYSTRTIKDIITNCTYGEVDPDTLPIFDIEWIFLQLRIKSKGSDLRLKYTCNNIPEGQTEVCGTEINLNLNLEELEIKKNPEHTKTIKFTEDSGFKLKYPTLDIFEELESYNSGADELFGILVKLIDTIYDKDSVTPASDFSEKELTEWVESFGENELDQIYKFFETYPRLSKTLTIKCPKCGHEEQVTLEGLQSFLF